MANGQGSCAAWFPVVIQKPNEPMFSTGLAHFGGYFYMSGKMSSTGETMMAKITEDGETIEKIRTYTSIERLDDC